MTAFIGVHLLSGFVRNTSYLVACLSALGVLTSPATAQVPPQTQQASQGTVSPKQAFASAFQKYRDSTAEVHPVTRAMAEVNPQPGAAQRTKQGNAAAAAQHEVQKQGAAARAQQTYYDVNAVNKRLTTLKEDIFAAIPQDDAPLRRYVEEQFPSALSGTNGYITQQQWDQANTEARSLNMELGVMDRLQIDFKVNSVPDNATFTFFAFLDKPASINTNNTITGMWRGTYSYKVERPGFVPVKGTFNTVQLAFTTFECTLVVDQKETPLDGGRCVFK